MKQILDIFSKKRIRKKDERKIKIFSLLEKVRMVAFPLDFVEENKNILRRILREGHELGIHGWKHRRWTRGFNKINIPGELRKAVRKYKKIFGLTPSSFCAPAFRIDKKTIFYLNKMGIKIVSDFEGRSPKKIFGTNTINVPITIKGKNNTPIIEYLVAKGFSDKQILKYLKKEIKKRKYATIYVHGLFECIKKISLMEDLFIYLKKEGIRVKTLKQLAEKT